MPTRGTCDKYWLGLGQTGGTEQGTGRIRSTRYCLVTDLANSSRVRQLKSIQTASRPASTLSLRLDRHRVSLGDVREPS